MKTLKKVLSLTLALAMALSLCACGGQPGATKEEVAQTIEDANEVAGAAGYSESPNEGLNRPDDPVCDRQDCTDPDPGTTAATSETSPDTIEAEPEPEVIKAEHLPILMNYIGTWLDQNGDPMSYADAKRFFKRNREYAKVAVAINSLCEELQSDGYQHDLDTVHDWATAAPHNTDEYLTYEWILSEMEANYDNYLDDLLALIGDQIDLDSSPAANVATCIILEKMLQFRDDGTYEASINPHRKHDCETEGCNSVKADTVLASLPVVRDFLKLGEEMTDAEIIDYLNEQNTGPTTQFDREHPNTYFDRSGRSHSSDNNPNDRSYYYATSNGEVYKLNDDKDYERIGMSPISDAEILSNYVGTTNRRLK